MLTDENLKHVIAHQWPLVSYEEEMEEYRKKYQDEAKSKVEKKKRFTFRGLK